MFADNARGSGNAPWMALPTICAGELVGCTSTTGLSGTRCDSLGGDMSFAGAWGPQILGDGESGRQDRSRIHDSRRGQIEFRSGRNLCVVWAFCMATGRVQVHIFDFHLIADFGSG